MKQDQDPDVVRVDPDTWPHRRQVKMGRFIFAMRSPLPLPHGFAYSGPSEALGTGISNDDVNWVSLIIHQVEAGPALELQAADAVASVTGSANAEGVTSVPELDPALRSSWAVVEAITPHVSTRS